MGDDVEFGFAATKDGGRIYYEVMGQRGAPFVLLLCSLGGPVSLWGEFRLRLAEHFRVISLDARGVGRSSHAIFPTSTVTMTQDVLAVLEQLGVFEVKLFGISLGGMVSTRLAIYHPERVSRLVLASTPPSMLFLSRESIWRGLRMASYLRKPAKEALILMTKEILSEGFMSEHPQELALVEEAFQKTSTNRKDLLLQLSAAATHHIGNLLPKISAKTLILSGDQDKLLSPAAPLFLQRKISGSTLVSLENTGHDLVLERPQETASLVIDFLREG